MPEYNVLEEAQRQLSVCTACRFCEGFCAVFPEVSARQAFTAGDVTYIANLCHDCRNCYDACMFVPPHEFAINIPKILSEARVDTYEQYAFPLVLSKLFKRSAWPTVAIGVVVALLVILGVAARFGTDGVFAKYLGEGAFYKIVAYQLLVIPALAATVWGLFVTLNGARRFVIDTSDHSAGIASFGAWMKATWDAMILRYLEGGGVGCYYPAKRGSSERKVLHMFVFWGFILDFVSTSLAFVYQDIFGVVPPFPLTNPVVVIGIVGGVMLVVGTTGLLFAKRRSDPVPTSEAMKAMDYVFIGSLDIVALTGLLTVFLRGTELMPVVFAIHLGVIAAFFITAPYGKFVHFIYRVLALVKMHVGRQEKGPAGPSGH